MGNSRSSPIVLAFFFLEYKEQQQKKFHGCVIMVVTNVFIQDFFFSKHFILSKKYSSGFVVNSG